MSLWAIVPVKPLRRGKSRLADLLSDDERERLNQSLLVQTIQILRTVPVIDETVVISHDPAALSVSREFGIRTIQENRGKNINQALRKATIAAKAFNITKLLVVPADLPLLTSNDIETMIAKKTQPPTIIIVPDRRMNGTNALLIDPIGVLDYDFGPWSFKNHIEQAERKKIHVEIFNNEHLSFDLDLPEDLEYLKRMNLLEPLLMSENK